MNQDKIMNDLKSFIDKNKLTLKEMSELANISSSTISRCYNGKTNMTERSLKKIADVLETFKNHDEEQLLKNNKSKNINNSTIEFDGIKVALEYERKYLLVKNEVVTNKEGHTEIKLIMKQTKSHC